MKRMLWMALGMILLAGGPVRAGQMTLVVTADKVNLRARALPDAEVVAQVSRETRLNAAGSIGDWYNVEAPTGIVLWVRAEFVADGVVAARVNVRGGPGITFAAVGALKKGDRVEVRGTRGDWLMIAPPPGCLLWIHRDYVKTVGETPVVAAAPVAGGSNSAPAAVAGAVPQENAVPGGTTWEGVVRPVDFLFRRPGNFRLARQSPAGGWDTICYLKGNDPQLKSFEGRSVRITGRDYWLSQTRQPVVIPETITPLP